MRIFVFLLTAYCLLLTANSYASNYQITNIEALDNVVAIKISGPIKYKIYNPADPFRVIVDMEGVGLGKFKEKIFFQKAGITEITPSQIEMPVITSRLDILLQSPSGIKPEIKGDTLMLYIETQADKTRHDRRVEAKSETGSAAKEIAAVLFDKTDEGIEFVIKGDGIMPEPAVFELDGKIIIDIPDVVMKASLPSSIPSPVKDLKYKAEKGIVRFILDIEGKADTEIVAMEDEIIVDIAFKDRKIDLAKRDDIQKAPNSKLQTPNSNLVSLDFQDADIVPILRLLGDVSGYNIVVHPDVKGKITMKLMNVPWEQALDVILKTFNLEKVVEKNVIRVATIKAFQDERKAVVETKEVFGKAEDVETKVFVVNYANVDKVKDSIDKAKVLSPRGSISTDTRTRSLIVKDITSGLNEIKKLIETLDKATPQVLIESRIIEVSTNFSKSLGVEWGLRWTPKMGDQNTNIVGSAPNLPTVGRSPGLINLPATTTKIVSPTSAITLGYLNAAQTLGLDVRLSAIEAIGKAKLLSTPKIMTLENEQAIIRHGKRIPITTPGATQGTFTTTYIDANLKITVTPQVAPDGTIFLKIEVNKDEPDYTNKDTLGNPAIDTRSVSTQVLAKDGETVVIGGILKSSESDSGSGVPGISKVPILGWLFKRETKETSSEELLIFITPRIVRQ